jgi:phenylacetate-CoA ligase
LSDTYLNEIWHHLLSFNPDFIYAYPSAAYIVAKYVKNSKSKLPESLKAILLGSENIYNSQRDFIEDIFRVKTFAWYGHSEKLVLAGECEYDRIYHAYPQYGFVEFINQNNETAKPGELAEIIGTGFINTVMPFIRYRTGDWCVYLGDHCSLCKRNYPVFKNVQGRWIQEMLVGRDLNLISMSAINVHSKEFERVSRFQYFQEQPGKATLKLVPSRSFSKFEEQKIFNTIQDKLKDTIVLDIQLVNDIPNTVSGKFKFIDQRLNIEDFK